MYDEKGQAVWEARLDIYGKVHTFAGRSLSECPFRYQGQYEDCETGLYYNRFRYYDPDSGNYLSQDPIKLAGNNPTFYGYVKDVNTWIDVWGLKGAVTAVLDVGGQQFKAISETLLGNLPEGSPFKGVIQDALDEVTAEFAQAGKLMPDFMGNCAELNAIQKALNAGYSLDDLKGSQFISITETKTGKFKSPCECCQKVLDRLDIKVKCH
jgi:RHS repeat-associated protein